MNLREQILKEHSKSQCVMIQAWVGNTQSRFDELFALYTGGEALIMQRAGWPLLNCVRLHTTLMTKHIPSLISYLKRDGLHQACPRNGFGILDSIKLPKSSHARVMDLCFRAFASHDESIAAKAYALGVLTKLAKLYPEIIDEIKLLIQYQPQPLPPALRSRAAAFAKGVGARR